MSHDKMDKPKSAATFQWLNRTYPKVQFEPSELKRIGNANGPGYEVIIVDGIAFLVDFPKSGMIPDPRTNIPNLRNMETRKDDVFICAYPKSGTNWMWQIVKMLQRGTTEYEKDPKAVAMLEFQSLEKIQAIASPRVFNTHLFFESLPKTLTDNKSKVIFIQRNPKDVVVSLLHHILNLGIEYRPNWNDFVSHFQEDEVFFCAWNRYIADWEKNLKNIPEENLLMLYYEDLKQHPISEIKKIAKFLGSQCDDNLIEEIAERCSFQQLKAEKVKEAEDPNVDAFKKKAVALYRKGEVGDWKNWFTVAQNEEFDLYIQQALKNSKFVYKYE